MDPNKALDTNDLSGNFFKHHWEIVGNDTISFYLDVLNGNKNISSLNETMIILIPKIRDPCELTNFRPISLCRFVYKIISKVSANRLKAVLPSCISQNQSAFIPRRIVHDNILIVHELLHYLQSSKNEPNKGFVVKLDMSKAYDRLESNFIKTIMKKMGSDWKWVEKIMDCVRSIKYTVKCNNILSDIFIPERGLHQGDPLSPYLFLFCMEAFSRMLIHAQENKILRGIRASRNGPRINHLLFADDTLLFVRNKKSDVESLVNMLNNFSNISGVIDDIQAKLSRTWWSRKDKGRQWWKLINKKDSLCFKVLSSKYFPDSNIFHAKKVDKASFTWSSIAAMAEALKDGFGWQIGNGDKINIWMDNWGIEGLNGDVIRSNILNPGEMRVNDLWHADRRCWNVNKVNRVYGKDWGDKFATFLLETWARVIK
ncbi:hypothetical protein PVK06_011519 [Gossypium arboreum]|uniref:Reverse transcriptase domain-containing protein n=1 Tax=Gossypium arboreum TaxID=29729 RepID=A0ABR0Q8Y6_GOSAR|nr:hypothetical protein PVK06_011519 [Gossypium arboreum]